MFLNFFVLSNFGCTNIVKLFGGLKEPALNLKFNSFSDKVKDTYI